MGNYIPVFQEYDIGMIFGHIFIMKIRKDWPRILYIKIYFYLIQIYSFRLRWDYYFINLILPVLYYYYYYFYF